MRLGGNGSYAEEQLLEEQHEVRGRAKYKKREHTLGMGMPSTHVMVSHGKRSPSRDWLKPSTEASCPFYSPNLQSSKEVDIRSMMPLLNVSPSASPQLSHQQQLPPHNSSAALSNSLLPHNSQAGSGNARQAAGPVMHFPMCKEMHHRHLPLLPELRGWLCNHLHWSNPRDQ